MNPSKANKQRGFNMKIFILTGAILAATAISGAAGAVGVSLAVIIANCYHAFD